MRRLSKRVSAGARRQSARSSAAAPDTDPNPSTASNPNENDENNRVRALLQRWVDADEDEHGDADDAERERRRAVFERFLEYCTVSRGSASDPATVDEEALIRDKLTAMGFARFVDALVVDAGATTIEKLQDLSDADLGAAGLNMMDIVRLKRESQSWTALPWLDVSMDGLSALPPGPLRFAAHIDLTGSPLESFPSDYEVMGELKLDFCAQLLRIEGGLQVRGALQAERCLRLQEIGADVSVGSLRLFRCEALERLPLMDCLGEMDLSYCRALQQLPDGLHVRGALRLRHCASLTALPAGLVCDGPLMLRHSGVRAVPADAQLQTLDIADCDGFSLPDGFSLSGSLLLDEYTFAEGNFPRNLSIGENLDLEVLSLRVLPPITVKGQLRLGLALQEIEPPLKVGGQLSMRGCAAPIPEGTELEASITLENCHGLRALQGVRCGGSLTLRNCSALARLEDIDVGGTLDVRSCTALAHVAASVHGARGVRLDSLPKLEELPERWHVQALELRGTRVKELRALTVDGELGVYNSPLRVWGDDVRVGGSVRLDKVALTALPESFSEVKGNFRLDAPQLESLPPRLRVGGALDLCGCAKLERLDETELLVRKDVSVQGCQRLKRLFRDGFHALGTVNASNCPQLEHTGRFRAERDVLLNKSAITALEGVEAGGSLHASECVALLRVGDDVKAGMDLVLNGCTALAVLPRSVTTAGSFSLKDARALTVLPESVDCGWDFNISGTRVSALPARLCRVRGDLVAHNTINLQEVGAHVRVDGHVSLRGATQLRTILAPWANIYSLDITGTKVTTLPARLHLRGDLLLANTDVVELPADLRVGGELVLTGCRRLRRFPPGMRVAKSIIAIDCDRLVSLGVEDSPSGTQQPSFAVQGDLCLSNCVSLQELPDGLVVAGLLDCSGCSALWSIGSCRVNGDGRFAMCVSLTSVAPGAFFGGSFDLFGCSALSVLPEDLHVGNALRLTECISVSTLPQRILDWPLTASGAPHLIDVTGSGIFDEELEACRARAGPGVDLRVSRPNASPVRNFNRLRDAAQFWLDKANLTVEMLEEEERQRAADAAADAAEAAAESGDAAAADGNDDDDDDDRDDDAGAPAGGGDADPDANDDADEDAQPEQRRLTVLDLDEVVPRADLRGALLFLSKLTGAKEFQREDMRSSLARRVVEVLQLLVREEDARDELLTRMGDSVDACNDKPVQALNQCHLIVRTVHARGDREALRRLGLGLARLQVVQAHAQRKIDSFRRPVDEVVIFLRFEIALSHDLELPISSLDMLFPNFVRISEQELDAARTEALRITPDSEVFERWLEGWTEWQRQLRLEAAKRISFRRLPRNSRRFSLSWQNLFGQPMADPVRVGKAVFSLHDLLRHWIKTGMDLNNTPRSVAEMLKLTRCKDLAKEIEKMANDD